MDKNFRLQDRQSLYEGLIQKFYFKFDKSNDFLKNLKNILDLTILYKTDDGKYAFIMYLRTNNPSIIQVDAIPQGDNNQGLDKNHEYMLLDFLHKVFDNLDEILLKGNPRRVHKYSCFPKKECERMKISNTINKNIFIENFNKEIYVSMITSIEIDNKNEENLPCQELFYRNLTPYEFKYFQKLIYEEVE